MRVAIIGGTGFVGSYLTDALSHLGHSVALLVRPGSEIKIKNSNKVEMFTGDIQDIESIRCLIQKCDAVIYNVGILREVPSKGISFEKTQYQGLVNTVNVALEVGVKRLLLMSANGVKVPGTKYQETKRRAEEYALDSELDVTVIRPSVIFGDPRGMMEFASQLFKQIVRMPIPATNFLLGLDSKKTSVEMSPVHINDVVQIFIIVLGEKDFFGKIITLGGPEILTWKEIITRIAAASGHRKWFLPMPISLMKIAATLLDWLPFFPVTRGQLIMMEEGNTADPEEMQNIIGKEAIAFTTDNLEYLLRK
jgi:NADH dehydrogenase